MSPGLRDFFCSPGPVGYNEVMGGKNMDPTERKKLRNRILADRSALSPGERVAKSTRICRKLLDLDRVRRAATIFTYMDFRSEVQTREIISGCLADGKTVMVPLTLHTEQRLLAVQITDPHADISPGYCGIPEPAKELLHTSVCDPATIDVVFVPGSVFDCSGGRLGYGGGYYDRFLSQESPKAFRVGLAFEMQLVDRVPVQPHDQFMDMVITEEKIYDCRRIRNAQDSCLS
jgi:5-formyltetrahydrofolate cyclo-ligase